METMYIVAVAVLGLLAVFDLMVGVSNDAVNFINSAVGSKVASLRKILIVASLGILVGALLSNGMMEVARKGIFHPEVFSFADIMIVFLSVMIADVILLDFYNTLKLPTSTTVSVVFELLGAAFAVALVIIMRQNGDFGDILTYINYKNAGEIISGILLSVTIAFIAGMVIQSLVRAVFTFEYEKKLTAFGSLRGGIAITAITYFLLIKGIKDSSLISADQLGRIEQHTGTLLISLVVGRTAILQLLRSLRRVNIMKVVVLVGTFALAMAFAGNDLVNFIGVPLAGLQSFQLYMASGMQTEPSQFMMAGLAAKTSTPFLYLFAAGLVMTLTLRFSSKARSVTETEVGLAKESVGREHFKPGTISRFIVSKVVGAYEVYKNVMPMMLLNLFAGRFAKRTSGSESRQDKPAFDVIRASVNLTVSSILIARATSMKLPLSTTYVTFMVAMGSSLADGVWGRESAVYRVSGVLTVIGGRFMTALCAFIFAAVVAFILMYTGFIGMLVLLAVTCFFLYKTSIFHAKKVHAQQKKDELRNVLDQDLPTTVKIATNTVFPATISLIENTLIHVAEFNERGLEKDMKDVHVLVEHSSLLKEMIHTKFETMPVETIAIGHHYIKAIDYMRKMSKTLDQCVMVCYEYVRNQHPEFVEDQASEMQTIIQAYVALGQACYVVVERDMVEAVTPLKNQYMEFLVLLDTLKKNQLKRIKEGVVGVRNSMAYLQILSELTSLSLQTYKVAKHYIDLNQEFTGE